jgi:hypothetical protein
MAAPIDQSYCKGSSDESKGARRYTLSFLALHCAQPWRDLWWNCRDGIGHLERGRASKVEEVEGAPGMPWQPRNIKTRM